MKKLLFAILLLPLLSGAALAQYIVQPSASHLDGSATTTTLNTTAATATLTPNNGSVYIQNIHVSNCAGSAAVTAAAITSITSTNLGGWGAQLGSGTTAGGCVQDFVVTWPPGGFKAPAGQAVTVTLPTFATNQTIRVDIAWNSAP